MIKFSKDIRYDGSLRTIHATYGRYTLGFGIYRWPWVPRWNFYNTFLAQLIDETGFLPWLMYVKKISRDGYEFVNIRLLCVGVGFKWLLAGEVAE